MSRLRTTLMTLPAAAATAALLMSAVPASAAPRAAAPTTAAVWFTPSALLDIPMSGSCENTSPDPIVAMQRINWMWAPIALDDPGGKPLPKVLVPNTIDPDNPGMRQRHDLLPTGPLTAPGPTPQKPTKCTFHGVSPKDGPFIVIVTGTVVTIPMWLDALQPPIKAPIPPPKSEL